MAMAATRCPLAPFAPFALPRRSFARRPGQFSWFPHLLCRIAAGGVPAAVTKAVASSRLRATLRRIALNPQGGHRLTNRLTNTTTTRLGRGSDSGYHGHTYQYHPALRRSCAATLAALADTRRPTRTNLLYLTPVPLTTPPPHPPSLRLSVFE